MNERIRELAKEAGFTPGIMGLERFTYFDTEKFAESIVRECADVASINQHQYNSTGSYVLKHFGIE